MRHRSPVLALAATGFLLGLASPMFAGNPSFGTITNPAPITYSPDAVQLSGGSITVINNNWDHAFCVAFTADVMAGGVIGYDLKKPYPSPVYVLNKTGTATSVDQVLSGAFVSADIKSATKVLTYAVVANPGYFPAPDTYTVKMTVKLYASALPTGTAVSSVYVYLYFVVGTSLDVAIVPVGSAFSLGASSASLPFGDFSEGTSRSIDAIARSNVVHSIALSSAKGWALANTDPLDTSLVAYSITRNGTPLGLTAGSAVSLVGGGTATGLSGTLYRLAFTLLPFTELPTEGSYADTLTLTMSAP